MRSVTSAVAAARVRLCVVSLAPESAAAKAEPPTATRLPAVVVSCRLAAVPLD